MHSVHLSPRCVPSTHSPVPIIHRPEDESEGGPHGIPWSGGEPRETTKQSTRQHQTLRASPSLGELWDAYF